MELYTPGWLSVLEIMGNRFAKLAPQRWACVVPRDPGSAERFIPEMALRQCMERGSWVVVVTHGTRFLGRFRFHSETQAGKFIGSAARQGFRAEIEGESEATAPILQHRAV